MVGSCGKDHRTSGVPSFTDDLEVGSVGVTLNLRLVFPLPVFYSVDRINIE